MLPFEVFQFCPRCAAAIEPGANPLRCASCDFTYYFNPTVAAAAFIFDDQDRVILIRRDREPAKGKLTIPGGFIDIDESAEVALTREVREEVGLEIAEIAFLLSEPNRYVFKKVIYPVCDVIFTAKALSPDQAKPLDGASDLTWRKLSEIESVELAFPSVKRGLISLQERL